MKALRYLLIVASLVSVLSVRAQSTAQLPEVQMNSTSGMVYSGSTLPQAAASGTVVTGSTPGTFSSTGAHGGIRKIGDSGSGTGGNEAQENENPWKTPLGDAAWPLALCALAYLIVRVVRRRKRA